MFQKAFSYHIAVKARLMLGWSTLQSTFNNALAVANGQIESPNSACRPVGQSNFTLNISVLTEVFNTKTFSLTDKLNCSIRFNQNFKLVITNLLTTSDSCELSSGKANGSNESTADESCSPAAVDTWSTLKFFLFSALKVEFKTCGKWARKNYALNDHIHTMACKVC